VRRLAYQPLEQFVVDGELREVKEPDGKPTTRQFAMLNALGCLVVVEPGSAAPLTRAAAAGAISAASRLSQGSFFSE
jgi:hypothetical protein